MCRAGQGAARATGAAEWYPLHPNAVDEDRAGRNKVEVHVSHGLDVVYIPASAFLGTQTRPGTADARFTTLSAAAQLRSWEFIVCESARRAQIGA
jgi:hypothetical protein